MSDLRNDIKNAIKTATAEVTGKQPRKTVYVTRSNESKSFFEGKPTSGPIPPANAPKRPVRKRPYKKSIPFSERKYSDSFGGQKVYAADDSGRGVAECWRDLFEQNETMKLTDPMLVEWMLTLFPERRESKNMMVASRIRAQYNSGRLPGMYHQPPDRRSRRFGRVGKEIFELTNRGYYAGPVHDLEGATTLEGLTHSSIVPYYRKRREHKTLEAMKSPRYEAIRTAVIDAFIRGKLY